VRLNLFQQQTMQTVGVNVYVLCCFMCSLTMKFAGRNWDDSLSLSQIAGNLNRINVDLEPAHTSGFRFVDPGPYHSESVGDRPEEMFHQAVCDCHEEQQQLQQLQQLQHDLLLDEYIYKCEQLLAAGQFELGQARQKCLLHERNSWNLLKTVLQIKKDKDGYMKQEAAEIPSSLSDQILLQTKKEGAHRKEKILSWLEQAEHAKRKYDRLKVVRCVPFVYFHKLCECVHACF
jgi:hypothetical protein